MIDRLRRALGRAAGVLLPGDGLTQRTVTGGAWVGATNVADRALQLTMVVVLARLLDPEAFGLMGVTLLTLVAVRRLTQFGIDPALIQHAAADVDDYLDTAWTLQLARGVVLGAVVFASAPLAASAFGRPEVTELIRAIAVVPVLAGLRNPGVIYLEKDLQFHRRFAYEMSARVVQVPVAIWCGVVFRSVWALVAGLLANHLVTVGASYAIHGYRPALRFDRDQAGELLGYGRWILGSSMLAFLASWGDDAFLGWFLGASALGVYQLAYRFSNAPATEISHTISRAVFPAYAKLQEDRESLRTGYLLTLRLVAMVVIPATVGLVVTAPPFVEGVLGADWAGTVRPLQVLAAYGLIRALRTTTVPLFRATGRPELETWVRAVKLVVLAGLIYPATAALGTVGTAAAVVASGLVALPLAAYFTVEALAVPVRRLLGALGFPALGTAIMAAVVLAVRAALGGPAVVELVVLVAVGAVTYLGALLAFERWFGAGARSLLRTVQEGIG